MKEYLAHLNSRGYTNITLNLAIRIRGKGEKTRQVMLPTSLKNDLKMYMELEKPDKYLFPGRIGKYSIKSVQKIFENALRKSGIRKKASCHSLRHSFERICWKAV